MNDALAVGGACALAVAAMGGLVLSWTWHEVTEYFQRRKRLRK